MVGRWSVGRWSVGGRPTTYRPPFYGAACSRLPPSIYAHKKEIIKQYRPRVCVQELKTAQYCTYGFEISANQAMFLILHVAKLHISMLSVKCDHVLNILSGKMMVMRCSFLLYLLSYFLFCLSTGTSCWLHRTSTSKSS